ncbi:MAG: gamma-glutamyl-gamma-aminobutyrate hydrolase family protein [Phycisphaerae bacterium]|nr:gamma-glutamyl-gamma-aminobutyrate hydrolase family protein [Phycisphaerae bacterium]MDW8261150.1 gamma-glutamyl-gamma-aminobutyrate hydrolase family protein [Phycisphaerales bacterium]
MSRPVIAITADHNDRMTQYAAPFGYASSVERAGGLPILLPYRSDLSLISQYVDEIDGVVFSGGNDLNPSAYGEAWHPRAVPIDPEREKFERALLAEVERRRLPVLGICLGSQLINLHRGGTMHQFLPDVTTRIEHRNLDRGWTGRHPVTLAADSTLARKLGKQSIMVNTSHKQAIRNPGRGLRVIATAPDGVIEGIEDPSLPLFLGVQWHPERMTDDPDQMKLFELLIQAADGRGG